MLLKPTIAELDKKLTEKEQELIKKNKSKNNFISTNTNNLWPKIKIPIVLTLILGGIGIIYIFIKKFLKFEF
jgi:hypothetical protein